MEFQTDAATQGGSNEIDEKQNLLGYISNVTPLLTSGNRKYFNCHIHTRTQKKRAVCFSPEKKTLITRIQEQKSPVKISKFKVNFSSPTKDIVISQDTEIIPTVLSGEDNFEPITVPTDSITSLDSLTNAVPEQLITVKAKVFHLSQPKKIITRNKVELTKQDGTLVDPTGQISIVLWQEQVDSIKEGETYVFKHIKVKDNQYGERYINPPKNTSSYSVTIAPPHEDILPDVNILPETIAQSDAVVCGVKDISTFKACFSCHSKIVEKNGQGNCTKCRMTVKLGLCKTQCFMRLSFMTIPDNKIMQLSVFSPEAALLASLMDLNVDKCTVDDLTKQLFEIDTLVVTYDTATNKLINVTKK